MGQKRPRPRGPSPQPNIAHFNRSGRVIHPLSTAPLDHSGDRRRGQSVDNPAHHSARDPARGQYACGHRWWCGQNARCRYAARHSEHRPYQSRRHARAAATAERPRRRSQENRGRADESRWAIAGDLRIGRCSRWGQCCHRRRVARRKGRCSVVGDGLVSPGCRSARLWARGPAVGVGRERFPPAVHGRAPLKHLKRRWAGGGKRGADERGGTLLGQASACEAWLPERSGREAGWGRREDVPTGRVPSRAIPPRCTP